MNDLGVTFQGVGCWGTHGFGGSYIFLVHWLGSATFLHMRERLRGKGNPLWNMCVPAGVCVLSVCPALFSESISEEMYVFGGQLFSRVRDDQRTVVSRPQAMTLGNVPKYFGGTPGTLEDSHLRTREDTVVLLNWRTYTPSRPSGFLICFCLSSVEVNTCQFCVSLSTV